MLDLGIVAAQLGGYGGSEIFLLECLLRWQREARVTLYTTRIRPGLFDEFGIERTVEVVQLPKSRLRGTRYRMFHDQIVMPRMWKPHIGRHDAYFLFQTPAQLIGQSPSVWFASEPLRILYDLRIQLELTLGRPNDPLEPKLDYDRPPLQEWHVIHDLVGKLHEDARFDRLATHSRSTARYLESIYGRRADRIVYPGIREPLPWEPPSRPRQLLTVGRLWDHKRVDLLVDAMGLVDRSIELVVVGDGPDRPALRKQARDLGLGGRIRFLGEVPVARRDRLYRESAACLYAPVREPFGMVPLEAAAAGRATIGAPGGGWSEVLDERASRVAALSPQAFATAIEEVVLDSERAEQMGRAARDQVAPHSWDRTASELLALLRDEADRGARAATRHARRQRTELGAHYHVGYRASKTPRAWPENPDLAGGSDRPLQGYYSSRNRRTIDRHLSMAQAAGLDFFVVGWRVDEAGVSALARSATEKLFDAIEARDAPFHAGLELTLATDDPGIITDSIEYAREAFFSRPAYHRRARRPLVWYRLNDPLVGFASQESAALRRANRGVHAIATGGVAYHPFLPRRLRETFSGWSLHSPLEIASEDRLDVLWERFHRTASEAHRISVFTVSPGHDDRHLQLRRRELNAHRAVERRGLETYERMLDTALSLPRPDLVVVNSFNHFFENTHIEASKKHGDRYLRATWAFKERLARKPDRAPP